jgi:serine O-acetyltransferase
MNNDILRNTAEALFAAEEGGPSYIGLRESVRTLVDQLLAALFPRHIGAGCIDSPEVRRVRLATAEATLYSVLSFVLPEGADIEEIADGFLTELPDILAILKTDIRAAYEGDPAARSTDEIILSYPAFTAISTFRLAHALYVRGVPILPRMMTELAHEKTGIDIHPGATVGPYFFIDHGTGVVIGETTTIGEHVTLYQHVTLGAKNFEVGPDGTLVKGIKRHPDIGNYVVIYAGATILGGRTVIGDRCVVGGNVWLTHSLNAGETIVTRPANEKKGAPPLPPQ